MQKVLTNFHPDCGCCVAVHIGGSARLGGRDSGDAKDAIAALALTHWLAACKGGDQASEASAIFFSKQKKTQPFGWASRCGDNQAALRLIISAFRAAISSAVGAAGARTRLVCRASFCLAYHLRP